jgi:predicted GH43/DUF377 family glycosyl hydrolase
VAHNQYSLFVSVMGEQITDETQRFTVAEIRSLELERKSPLAEMYTLSPFVWKRRTQYGLLLRAVNRSTIAAEKVARVYYGHSRDGLRFSMGDHPVIAPGPGEDDQDGCEDPTLAIVEGTYYVYYTGWNQTYKRGQLLLAAGSDIKRLKKRGVALSSRPRHENPKEATIVSVADGTWRLFFEYAFGGASKIGIASARAVFGPWRILHSFFDSRPESWDSWHLSTGPVLSTDPRRPVMFYNGATQEAQWRIGWAVFDETYARIVARCEEPIITPPPPGKTSDTDIAFAASSVEESDAIYLYYSIADKNMFGATVRRST